MYKAHFDPGAIDQFFGGVRNPGARQMYLNCCSSILAKIDERLVQIKNAISEQDYQEVSNIAHSLKSGLIMTGGHSAGKIYQDIEANCHRLTQEELIKLAKQGEEEVKYYKKALADFTKNIQDTNN